MHVYKPAVHRCVDQKLSKETGVKTNKTHHPLCFFPCNSSNYHPALEFPMEVGTTNN
jgi:hypothetical protein